MSGLSRRSLLTGLALLAQRPDQPAGAAQATPTPAAVDARHGVAVSLLMQNSGASSDRLTGAASPIAQKVVLHATHLEHGQRLMSDVSDIEIPAHSLVSLEPGAGHLMLLGLRQSIVQSEVFPLTLQFADAGSVVVEVRVRRRQDAAGVPETPPVTVGAITILHASAPPAPVEHT